MNLLSFLNVYMCMFEELKGINFLIQVMYS